MYRLKNRKGQSTVEYILLVTAVVAVMIMFATNNNGGLRGKLNATLDQTANGIEAIGNRLNTSRPIDDPALRQPVEPVDYVTNVIPNP